MKRLLAILMMFTCYLQASEEDSDCSLSNFEGDISGIVNGVSVISGTYSMTETDYVIPGTSSLEFRRNYIANENKSYGQNPNQKINGFRWGNNLISRLLPTIGCDRKKECRVVIFNAPLKGEMNFIEKKKHENFSHQFRADYPGNIGYTNMAGGSPVSHIHPKSVNIFTKSKNDQDIHFDYHDGIHYHYRKIKYHYYPVAFIHPNNTISKFSFDQIKSKITGYEIWNRKETTCFGGINLSPEAQIGWLVNKIAFTDGKEVRFEYQKNRLGAGQNFKYLKSVERPHKPKQEYEYVGSSLSKIVLPEGRFIQLEYFPLSVDQDGNISPWYHSRIKELKAPSSFDGKSVTTHQFVYHSIEDRYHSRRTKPVAGCTKVYDANQHLTKYHYDNLQRLTSIDRYLGCEKDKYSLYAKESMVWDEEGKILSRIFKDADDKIHYARKYDYDYDGNVSIERIFGNLSGKGTVITLDKNGVPIYDHKVENRVKYYIHDKTRFHHIIYEAEVGKTTYFDYVPDTSLLASKITDYNGFGLHPNGTTREYYTYNENATLIETVSDDGTERWSKDDFSGVTQRLIKRILPRTTGHGIGLPLEQWNLYFDLESGQEKLLSHHINTYNDDYRLVSREYYDSEDIYLYTLTWEYDRYGNVIAETDPLGYKIFRKYDENSNLIWEQSPSGILTKEHTYDYCNRLIRTDMLGADGTMMSTTNTYDTMGRLLATQNHRGETTTYTYDELDRMIAIQHPSVYNAKGELETPIETFTYDVMGRKISSTDGRGFKTRKEYNAYGSVTKIIYPDGTQESSLYNLDNTPKEIIARSGTITRCEYDARKRPVRLETFDAEGKLLSTTKHTYNTLHLLSTILPNGTVVSYKYDGAGRLVAESTEDKLVTYEYDTLSRRCATLHHIDGDARVSRVVYDLKGQVVEERTENLAGEIFNKTTHLYDAEGNKVRSYTYGTNSVACTSMEYDPYGRVTCMTDNEGHSVITIYDECYVDEEGHKGLLTTQIDPLGIRSLAFHNAMGKVVKAEKQGITGETLSHSKRFYDLSGNLVEERHTVITPNKNNRLFVNCWEYDSFGKPLVQVEAYKSEEQKTTFYAYDSSGQLAETTLPSGIVLSQTYDALGRLTERYSSNGDLKQHFSYDIAGNPNLIKSLEGNIERKYDSLNRMTEEKLAHGATIGYVYDVFDRVTQLVLPDQSTVDYLYDAIHLRAVVRGSKVHTYDVYDLHGNLTAATLTNGETAAYSYNSLGRLESIETPCWSENEITYDPIGNITHFKLDNISHHYAYDELSQLKEERGAVDHTYQHDSLSNRTYKDGSSYTLNALNQVLSDGDQDYTYDVNGNLLHGDGLTFTYDSLGRATCITDGKNTYHYVYDPFNRRISSNDTQFIYQGEMEIGAIQDGKIVELRVLGKGRGAEGGAAVLIEIDGKTYTPLHDHNGHCAALLSGNKVVEKYHYSAFGEEKEDSYINPWRFSSKRHDPTGLINFGRRYYSPKLGRWITPDPKGFSAGPNLYAYCLNNPLVKFDLYGLDWIRTDVGYIHEHKEERSVEQKKEEAKQEKNWWQSAREKVGRSIEFVCHHLLPLREGYNIGSIGGRWIAGDGIQRYSADFSPAKHDVFSPGGCREGEKPMIVMNGINTSHSFFKNHCQDISKLNDGREVHGFYSPDEGLVCNLLKAVWMKCGLETIESKMMLDFMHNEFARDSNHPGFDVYGESRGSFGVSYLKEHLDSDFRKRVSLNTIGGKILVPDGAGDIMNHVAYFDPIPAVCDFSSYCVAMGTKPEYVKFYQSNHWWVHDFGNHNKPYMQVYKNDAEKFNERRGKIS